MLVETDTKEAYSLDSPSSGLRSSNSLKVPPALCLSVTLRLFNPHSWTLGLGFGARVLSHLHCAQTLSIPFLIQNPSFSKACIIPVAAQPVWMLPEVQIPPSGHCKWWTLPPPPRSLCPPSLVISSSTRSSALLSVTRSPNLW